MSKKIEELSDRELLEELVRQQKKDTIHEMLSAIANIVLVLVILGVCVVLVPRTIKTLDSVDQLVADTNAIVVEADATLDDINSVVSSLNTLVEENNEAINATLQNASQIDIDKLNESIEQFSNVVEPLARMFSIIGR